MAVLAKAQTNEGAGLIVCRCARKVARLPAYALSTHRHIQLCRFPTNCRRLRFCQSPTLLCRRGNC